MTCGWLNCGLECAVRWKTYRQFGYCSAHWRATLNGAGAQGGLDLLLYRADAFEVIDGGSVLEVALEHE